MQTIDQFLSENGIKDFNDEEIEFLTITCGSKSWDLEESGLFFYRDGDSYWIHNRPKNLIEVTLIHAFNDDCEMVNKVFLIPEEGFQLRRCHDKKQIDFLSFGMKFISLNLGIKQKKRNHAMAAHDSPNVYEIYYILS